MDTIKEEYEDQPNVIKAVDELRKAIEEAGLEIPISFLLPKIGNDYYQDWLRCDIFRVFED